MEIRINNQKLDVTLDDEKTVGEIMSALEEWLGSSGHRLSGVSIDGRVMDISSLEGAFSTDIDDVKVLDIFTSSITDLAVTCLFNLLGDIEEYDSLDFEEKQKYINNWKEKPAAVFASEQLPDIFSLFAGAFSNNDMELQVLRAVTEERLREIEDPSLEFTKLDAVVKDVCTRLVDLPLDVQTGKDFNAAQTIQFFSSLTEKIIRLLTQLDIQGIIDKRDDLLSRLVGEFTSTVKELLQAYEAHDTVLVGDLAEYETAPRLQELYDNVNKNLKDRIAK
jgi:molybdopterin converting factor small subunit